MDPINRTSTCPPYHIQANESNGLQQLVAKLEERWGDSWQSRVMFVGQGRAKLLFEGLEIEIQGLDRLSERLKELHTDEQSIQAKQEKTIERLSQVDTIQTALSASSMAFRFAAGAGLLAMGQVAGLVILGSACVSMAHEATKRLDGYEKASAALGGNQEEIAERKQLMENGVALTDLALSLASVLFGGSAALSEGIQAFTSTTLGAEHFTHVSSGAQGLVMLGRSVVEGQRGQLEFEYQGVRLQMSIHGAQRSDGYDHVESTTQNIDALFETQLAALRVKQRTGEVINRLPRRID